MTTRLLFFCALFFGNKINWTRCLGVLQPFLDLLSPSSPFTAAVHEPPFGETSPLSFLFFPALDRRPSKTLPPISIHISSLFCAVRCETFLLDDHLNTIVEIPPPLFPPFVPRLLGDWLFFSATPRDTLVTRLCDGRYSFTPWSLRSQLAQSRESRSTSLSA